MQSESIKRLSEAYLLIQTLYNEKFAAIEEKLGSNEELKRQIEELRRWKADAMQVMPDYQEIGKILGLKLGETVHDKIIPALRAARQKPQAGKRKRAKRA